MGVRDWGRRVIARRVVAEVPMLGKVFGWLTDPGAVGRKRTIVAVLAILVGVIRGAEAGFRDLCLAGTLHGGVCAVDPTTLVAWLDGLIGWLNGLTPGADAAVVVMGLWALIDARRKAAKQ